MAALSAVGAGLAASAHAYPGANRMSENLQQRIESALARVYNARVGADVLSSEMVRDVATTTDGKVRFTLLLAADDDATLVRDARQAVESVAGVTDVRVDVKDPSQVTARAPQRPAAPAAPKRSLPVMDAAPAARPTPAAPTPVGYPKLGRIIAVSSGKGGVGKSTVAVNLACALAAQGLRVGVVDLDVYGPSIPRMLGVDADPAVGPDKKLIPVEAWGLKTMSIGFMVDEGAPMIWRGPMASSAVKQMLQDTAWGSEAEPLDVLVMDLPPGTGDVQLTIVQKVRLSGAVIVSTPQEIALIDARRAASMFAKTGVPVLGVVENMAYFPDPAGGPDIEIFGRGGARAEAARLSVPFLGEIPLDPTLRQGGDTGRPLCAVAPETATADAFRSAARTLWDRLSA